MEAISRTTVFLETNYIVFSPCTVHCSTLQIGAILTNSRREAIPVRLERSLMEAAKIQGSLSTRTPSEQIQYWAMIGKSIESLLTSDDLLSLMVDTVEIQLVPKEVTYIDPMSVLLGPGASASNKQVKPKAMSVGFAYQASNLHPDKIEKVYPDGKVEIGTFIGGVFKVDSDKP